MSLWWQQTRAITRERKTFLLGLTLGSLVQGVIRKLVFGGQLVRHLSPEGQQTHFGRVKLAWRPEVVKGAGGGEFALPDAVPGKD